MPPDDRPGSNRRLLPSPHPAARQRDQHRLRRENCRRAGRGAFSGGGRGDGLRGHHSEKRERLVLPRAQKSRL